jgi:hypothetical protein
MFVTLFGIVTEVRSPQKPKAYEPMLVTLFGNVMEVKPQLPKANEPMLVTPFGMITDVSIWHPLKAKSPMLLTLPGITTFAIPLGQAIKVF